MPHIALPEGTPGLASLRRAYPRTGGALLARVDAALRGPSPLSAAERELIGAYVSYGNDCAYCSTLHAVTVRHLAAEEGRSVEGVLTERGRLPLDALDADPKLRALLVIAEMVRQGGRSVTGEDVARARAAGADDRAIHDTVLVASLFCMINRYVDGLATVTPEDPATYERIGVRLATQGYVQAPRWGRRLRRILRRLRRRAWR